MGVAESSGSGLLNGLELGAPICARKGLSVHNAKAAEGAEILVVSLDQGQDQECATAFAGVVRYGAIGGLSIHEADQRVAIASPSAAGTLSLLPALSWRLARRLEIFRKIAEHVHRFHQKGYAVGVLDPDYILLSDDLDPVLLGPRFVPASSLYGAPELTDGGKMDPRSDTYTLGRILQFIIKQDAPVIEHIDPPELQELLSYPAGLSRIVRKAVQQTPELRYQSVAELLGDLARYGAYDEVGLAHSRVEEQNLGGLSTPPAVRPQAPVKQIETSSEPQPSVDFTQARPFALRERTRLILLAGGVLSLAVGFGLSYLAGDPWWVRVILSMAAGLVGFAVFSPGIERESSLRAAFGLFLASAMLAFNPAPYIAEAAEEADLSSTSLDKREKAFKAQTDRGRIDFHGADLSGADLRDREFVMRELENVSFEGADLSGALFIDAHLKGARFRDARLLGTQFAGTLVDDAIDFRLAECDDKTTLPEGWTCADAHPKKSKR